MEAVIAEKHPTYPISVHRPGVDRDHPSVEPVSAGKEGEAHHAPRVWHAPLEAKRSAPALRREGCALAVVGLGVWAQTHHQVLDL